MLTPAYQVWPMFRLYERKWTMDRTGIRWGGVVGSRALAVVFAILAVVSLVVTIVTGNWALIGLVVAMNVAAVLTFWSVRVDDRGLEARGTFGWPRVRVAVEDIQDVAVVDVHAMRDWAGWGLRFRHNGDTGVVLRSGPSLSVTTKRGRRTVVTVREPERAVAMLKRVLEDRR